MMKLKYTTMSINHLLLEALKDLHLTDDLQSYKPVRENLNMLQ